MGVLTAGAVAKRARVNAQTIHFYERRGLLPKAPRSSGNYRLFEEATVHRVLFIKKAQALGFTLDEIKELLCLRAEPREQCEAVRSHAEAKVRAVEEKIAALERMRTALTLLIDECTGRRPATPCPILSALESGEEA